MIPILRWPLRRNRTLGIALIASGILLLVGGIAAWSYCSSTVSGMCVDLPYQGVGLSLVSFGVILLVLGIVLILLKRSRDLPASRNPS